MWYDIVCVFVNLCLYKEYIWKIGMYAAGYSGNIWAEKLDSGGERGRKEAE